MWTSANLDYLRTHQQGDFGDMSSWRESHMLFRSKGEIKTTLNLWAFARMAFNSDEVELFGLDKFGATFSIPGLVTVGPNLRVKAVSFRQPVPSLSALFFPANKHDAALMNLRLTLSFFLLYAKYSN